MDFNPRNAFGRNRGGSVSGGAKENGIEVVCFPQSYDCGSVNITVNKTIRATIVRLQKKEHFDLFSVYLGCQVGKKS